MVFNGFLLRGVAAAIFVLAATALSQDKVLYEKDSAYRRDRRKDVVLQEQGYFVMRFLAEDLAKHLDEVLDAILRTLAHRERTIPRLVPGSPDGPRRTLPTQPR